MNAAAEILRAGDDASVAIRVRSEARRLDLTRGELRRRVVQAAGAFAALGVEEEQRVLIVLPDCPELVVAFLGAMWNGSVPVLVNSFLRPDAYAAFVHESRARAVVTVEAIADALRGETGFARRAPVILTVDAAGGGTFAAAIEGHDARMERAARIEAFPTDAEDPAFWLYSSGTTGRPKAVVHVHRAIPHVLASYGTTILATCADDVAYSTSKLFFAYGLGAGLYFPLAAGGTTVLSPDPFSPERAWRTLVEEAPSLFFAVPSAYRALLEHVPADAAPAFARMRRCVSAGEALPEAIFDDWRRRFGVEILDGFGSTEALHIVLSNTPGACVPGTLGRPVPGYEVQLVDDDGAVVAPGVPGGVRVRGDSIAAGYWQRAEATRHAFVGGWYVTGDQAVANDDGTIRVLGRRDDLLKISGQWVSPVDVEEIIAAVAGVGECGVIGVPDASGFPELVACVVAAPDAEAGGVVAASDAQTARPRAADDANTGRLRAADTSLRGRIDEVCRDRLPRFKRPKRILCLDALPRTATGKLQRALLREWVSQETP